MVEGEERHLRGVLWSLPSTACAHLRSYTNIHTSHNAYNPSRIQQRYDDGRVWWWHPWSLLLLSRLKRETHKLEVCLGHMVSARTTREVSETLSQCQKTNIGQEFISVMGYWPGMCKMLCSIPRTEEEMVERPFLPRWVHTENAEETMPTMPGCSDPPAHLQFYKSVSV